MPLKNEDRANAAKMGMEMMKKKVAGASKYAGQMAAAGREEATQASEVGASQTTMDEKTGKNANKAKTATNAMDMADDAITRSKNAYERSAREMGSRTGNNSMNAVNQSYNDRANAGRNKGR